MSRESAGASPGAIAVHGLSKRYRIGVRERRAETLAGALADLVRAPWRNLRSLRALTRFSADDGPDVVWALREVSFSVAAGEVVGVIGRNGAGKSTLLKVLSRITEPTAGRAVIAGRVASLLEVGTGFHSELTGRENVYLNGTILGMRKAEIDRKFDEIVGFAEVERFIDTPVKRYSSGMKVRLAFAVAAHLEPEILLIDEVLAVGDVAFQKRCLGKMSEVATAGRTVLFVSHQLGAVRRLCPRSVLLEEGRLAADGSTGEVVGRYLESIDSGEDAVTELPPGDPDAAGRGVRLQLLDRRSRSRSAFRLGETLRIRLELRMERPAASVIAAVGILTADSVPVVTFWSEPRDLSPGDYELEIEPDVRLAAGVYRFAVGLSSHEQAFYRHSPGLSLIVSDAAAGDQPVRSSGAGLVISAHRPAITRIEAGEPVPFPERRRLP